MNPKNRKDYQEIFRILNVYLSYPDTDLATKHRNANRLGQLDLKAQKKRNMRETYIRVENEVNLILSRSVTAVVFSFRSKN
jgi:nitrate reductase assembly molybdenum cofactor insertion protein NarJ